MANAGSKLLVAAMVTLTPAIAQPAGKIRVCVAAGGDTPTLVLLRAETISARIFAPAGVAVEWRSMGTAACRKQKGSGIVEIEFVTKTPAADRPGALAYAEPYQGSAIVVMYDRIERSTRRSSQLPNVLAHVMTHEIAHLLQGVSRHSETGVMKAHWDPHDLDLMTWQPLPFAPEDIELIQRGLAWRAGRF